ncbi:MAG: branched-chain amino acid ABC transporter permease [Gemmatimonadetes bacterium]|nr:branched-chain amino acid ABC transporter permease [Gemmatimonadota bacterium]NIT66234.1 branched-chain amino acid ABC transporter permease [Gemmatimonadota bacterium]NIW76874.1 branched-chain amino acid ABC transporter permease [Gemmatimonadota bacterium]NIY34811.1 branched-chain amino acid ABC transporter permease [Gemmatimonadota bacterium]
MGIINLAHGAFYMLGAYVVYWLVGYTGNLFSAIALGLLIMLLFGYLLERLAVSYLYQRDHLYQVLLTYGLILILDELQKIFWGTDFYSVPVPAVLAGSIPLTETQDYPIYRLFISLVCMAIAAGLYVLIGRTRIGMMIRAGASNREMSQLLGIDIGLVFATVFSIGVALAAFSGMIGAPVSSVYPGMGDHILIISFVVVVIGGIGSVKGAFVGAMLIGISDTFGQVLLPDFASVVVYAVMAMVLLWRPQGLFGEA